MNTKIQVIGLGVWVIVIVYWGLMVTNPFGLGQRVFWGMAPPYHWVKGDVSSLPLGSLNETYVGVNGRECASVYKVLPDMEYYKVYGYGFSKEYPTQAMAEVKAMRECR